MTTQGPAVPRRRLGAELRRLRDEAGLTLDQAAESLECSTSKISRLETGKGLPKQRDVRDLVRLYGKQAEGSLERLLRLARDGARAGWWQEYTADLPSGSFVFDGVDRYVALESDATRLMCFDAPCFHGLLQTPEYARSIISTVLPDHTDAEVDRLVEFRMRRQEALWRTDSPLKVDAVVDEVTFRRVVGDSSIMAAQLEHLSRLVNDADVSIQVLPLNAGFIRASGGAFIVLEFEESVDQDVAFVESPAGASYLEGDFGVETFKGIFAEARERSLGTLESEEWIRSVGESFVRRRQSARKSALDFPR